MADEKAMLAAALEEKAAQPSLVETQVSAPQAEAIVTDERDSVKSQVSSVLASEAGQDIKNGVAEATVGSLVAPLEAGKDFISAFKESGAAGKEERTAKKAKKAAEKAAAKAEKAAKDIGVGLFNKVREFAGRDVSQEKKQAEERKKELQEAAAQHREEAELQAQKVEAAAAVRKEAGRKGLNSMIALAPTPLSIIPGVSSTFGGQINQFRGAKKVVKGALKLPKAIVDRNTGEPREDNWIVPDNGNWVEMGDRGIVPANNNKWHVNVDKKQYVARQTVESAIGPDGKPISIDRLMPVEPLYTTQGKTAA